MVGIWIIFGLFFCRGKEKSKLWSSRLGEVVICENYWRSRGLIRLHYLFLHLLILFLFYVFCFIDRSIFSGLLLGSWLWSFRSRVWIFSRELARRWEGTCWQVIFGSRRSLWDFWSQWGIWVRLLENLNRGGGTRFAEVALGGVIESIEDVVP